MYRFSDNTADSVVAYFAIRSNSSEEVYDINLEKLKFMNLGDYFGVLMAREETKG